MTDETTGSELVARHAELIGRVTITWSNVRAQAGQLFEVFCASPEARKRYWENSIRPHTTAIASFGNTIACRFPGHQLGVQALGYFDAMTRVVGNAG